MKKKLRKKWLDEMPERIISGDNSTYAEWLENITDSLLQDMHQYATEQFHKYRLTHGHDKFAVLDGKDFNEIIRLAKVKTKRMDDDL